MPSGIPYIVGNEAAERFSFYGMKAILAVFMTKFMLDASGQPDLMSDAEATKWISLFAMANYFFPILGAVLADGFLGKYRTILYLSLMYCLGHGTLALMDVNLGVDQRTLLFWGLAMIAIGSGGIKPCVASHVGDQFSRRNEHLLPIVFGWFYFAINIGATVSMLLIPVIREKLGVGWAFGVPGILMAIATFVFWLGRNKFVHVPPAGRELLKVTFSKPGRRAIFNLIPLYVFIAMFWALFDQTFSRWVMQAEDMDRNLWLFTPSAEQLLAANSILVMILVPLTSYVIYPAINKVYTLTPLRKVGIGLFVTVPAFAISGMIETWIQAGQTPHIGWQLLGYVVLTFAEILISITALEFSYTQAPNAMKSVIMGMFYLSVAFGNLFTAQVNHIIETAEKSGQVFLQGANYYWFFTGCMLVTAVLYLFWAPFYRGQTFIQSDEGNGEDAAPATA